MLLTLLPPHASACRGEEALRVEEDAVDVVDDFVDQLLLEGGATGVGDVCREADASLELGAGQGAELDTSVKWIVVIEAAGKLLAPKPFVDSLLGHAIQVIDQRSPDDSIGDPALLSGLGDLFPVLNAFDTAVEGHIRPPR